MNKIVRKGVFETNSSSAHSISLAKVDMDFILDTIYPDQDGVIKILGQEFGWAWEKFNDAETKLAYLFQDQGNAHFDLIVEVIKEQTGATEVIFDENGGYIDHESYGTAYEAAQDKESIKNFVFNKNSWLFTGNDNGSPDPMFYHVPIFKDGRQILPKYKYELVIEGLDKTTKFLDLPTDDELEKGIEAVLDNALLNERGQFIMEEGLFWQISRPRDFYEKSFWLYQDYSKKEIVFLKENDPRFNQLEEEIKKGNEKLDFYTRQKLVTEKARTLPGLTKTVKFQLKEL